MSSVRGCTHLRRKNVNCMSNFGSAKRRYGRRKIGAVFLHPDVIGPRGSASVGTKSDQI